MDYILQIIFQEEFHRFTINDFKRIYFNLRVKLQTHLLKRGVYVAIYNKRYTLFKALFDLLQEEKHKWTDKETIVTIKELAEPLITVVL